MGRDQNHPHQLLSAYRPVHNIRLSDHSVICLHRVATGSAYKMIWTHVVYAGIEIISIPAYAHVATCVQIILYALLVATLTQAYIVNRPYVPFQVHASQR